jgi:hippurate hydrolase
MVLNRVRTLTKTQAEGYGCSYEIREGIPGAVLVNDPEETEKAYEVARAAFGDDHVVYPGPTFLASEDFAFMLQQRKGTYCFIGNGNTPMVHHPQFTLNQEILPKGAAYWVALTEGYLR